MRLSSLVLAVTAVLAAFPAAPAAAAEPPPGELASIRNLSGCFRVTYSFFEDGEHDSFARGGPLGPITEWVGYETAEDGAITLAHASFNREGRVVPHWHEVWRHHPDSGTWTQEVRCGAPVKGEERELRYRCTAPWTMNRWQCHAGPTPKPFRDSGAPFGYDRKDYDVLDRDNVLLVTAAGWIHNEHNRKMTDAGAVVGHELGWIEYDRIDAAACAAAGSDFPRNIPGR